MSPFRFRFSNTLPFHPKQYISHLLIAISIIIAMIGFTFDDFIGYFGFHRLPFVLDALPFIFGQLIFFQFLHGSLLHLLLNSFFLYQAGPEVESRMSRSQFMRFFLLGTLFVASALYIFTSPQTLTIGISGFCMALLAYLWIDLHTTRHPMANQILIMLVINIALGLSGNISFVGHAAGALWGLIWWQFFRNKKKSFASLFR